MLEPLHFGPARRRARPALLALEARRAPAVLSTNLAAPTAGVETAAGSRWLAGRFATDGFAYTLTSITLKLGVAAGSSAELSVFSDADGKPGTPLGTLRSPASYSTPPAPTVFAANTLSLAANTTYWAVLRAPVSGADWAFTNDPTGTGPGFQNGFATSPNAGATWLAGGVSFGQLQVDALAAFAPAATSRLVAAGAGSGAPAVALYTANAGLVRNFAAPGGGTGGVRVATGDVDGDGTEDVVTGTGPGGSAVVAVVNGATGVTIATLTPFEPTFAGGVYVAAGDIDGDGKAEVVVTPDEGGGPAVVVYRGAAEVARFFGIDDANFRGGARPAVGDVDADGFGDLVVAAGFGGGPRVALFDGESLAQGARVRLLNDFFAFEETLRNGAFPAAGDFDNDGSADLAFGGGPGGGPRLRVFSGARLLAAPSFATLDAVAPAAQVANFFAGDPAGRGGVRAGAGDLTGDGVPELLAGSGAGEASAVRAYSGSTLVRTVDPFGAVLAGGVFVG